MLSIQQHKVQNAQYANVTNETAIVQIKAAELGWVDYSRCKVEDAVDYVRVRPRPENWRVIDWITGEEINTSSDITPERITQLINEQSDPWKE